MAHLLLPPYNCQRKAKPKEPFLAHAQIMSSAINNYLSQIKKKKLHNVRTNL
jgi:hypothetical protein